jgi:hypothetical protein
MLSIPDWNDNMKCSTLILGALHFNSSLVLLDNAVADIAAESSLNLYLRPPRWKGSLPTNCRCHDKSTSYL